MDLSKLLEGIREFFLEILGFLLPGIIFIFLFGFFVNSDEINLASKVINANHWLLLIFGYILGYVIYGLALTRDNILKWIFKHFNNKRVKVDEIKDEITESKEFEISKKTLKKLIEISPDDQEKIDGLQFHSIRNLAMSYTPEADKKIYTSMFRADLCSHLNIVNLIFGIIGIINSFCWHILGLKVLIFHIDFKFVIAYILLLLAAYFLNQTRFRFLKIAYKIPFSIFIAKYYHFKKEEQDV